MKIKYEREIPLPRAQVWEFVKDINNWAPMAPGYQSHEVISDKEYIWVIKGEVGPLRRTTKVRVVVTEWVEGERVGFDLAGLNEPISGHGLITLSDSDGGTVIRGDGDVIYGGVLGPVVNRLMVPFVQQGSDELLDRIVATLMKSGRQSAS